MLNSTSCLNHGRGTLNALWRQKEISASQMWFPKRIRQCIRKKFQFLLLIAYSSVNFPAMNHSTWVYYRTTARLIFCIALVCIKCCWRFIVTTLIPSVTVATALVSLLPECLALFALCFHRWGRCSHYSITTLSVLVGLDQGISDAHRIIFETLGASNYAGILCIESCFPE